MLRLDVRIVVNRIPISTERNVKSVSTLLKVGVHKSMTYV